MLIISANVFSYSGFFVGCFDFTLCAFGPVSLHENLFQLVFVCLRFACTILSILDCHFVFSNVYSAICILCITYILVYLVII